MNFITYWFKRLIYKIKYNANGLNYARNDNKPDQPSDWLMSARLFAKALGHLLKEREGICIILDDKKYIVYQADEMINIDLSEDADLKDFDYVNCKPYSEI